MTLTPEIIRFAGPTPAWNPPKRILTMLKNAKNTILGEGYPVRLKRSEPGPGPDVLCFGVPGGITTLSPKECLERPLAEHYLTYALARYAAYPQEPLVDIASHVLFLDVETHNAGKEYTMPAEEFFRLGQYAWGLDGEIVLTTSYAEVVQAIREARLVVAHNGHPFDFSVLLGDTALDLAAEGRLLDTMVYAALVMPAPWSYTNRLGHTFRDAAKPELAKKWLSLDNLCFQLGLSGKIGDLQELAKKYNPPKTLVRDLDYGLIPLDDPEFLEYARGDIVALRQLFVALMLMHKPTDYDWREQLNAAIDAQNSRNGFRVDVPVAQARADYLTERKNVVLTELQNKYGLPTTGKMPWRSAAGKAAILKALADQGITPETRPEWPINKTGPGLGGQVMLDITADTPAEDLGKALAELMGQRSLAQLALDSLHPDGKVHPDITALQRSGRKSTTKPGLTVWTSRGEGAIEKAYFIPDTPDESLVGFDYSQADARIVAAYSGDTEFAKRFEPGADAHEMTGRVVFGDEVYDSDPDLYRYKSKALGHGWAYRAGAETIARSSGQSLSLAEEFVAQMAAAYPVVINWQEDVTYAASGSGVVLNDWGRTMVVDPGREYTQAPALLGQSGTRELMVDALIRMLRFDPRLIRWLKAQIHDELIFSIPNSQLGWAVPKIKECMEVHWKPSDGGQSIHFPVGSSSPAQNWMETDH